MSDTPRTDEDVFIHDRTNEECVSAQTSRQLERELNKANRLLALARSHPYIPNSLAQLLNEPHKR